jgi:L-methionine (R)-S-oxide reductase
MNTTEIAFEKLRNAMINADLDDRLDDAMAKYSDVICDMLFAEECIITLFREAPAKAEYAAPQTHFGTVKAGRHGRREMAARRTMHTPIVLQRRLIGVLQVRRQAACDEFDESDLRMLGMVAPLIGKSIQVLQLRSILNSRFTQIALMRSSEPTIGQIVQGAAQNPNSIARILAKAFYREMTSAGFDFNQILHAASEVISELTDSLRKHRRHGTATPARLPQRETANPAGETI